MLTNLTCTTITLLNDVASSGTVLPPESYSLSGDELTALLIQLIRGDLIRPCLSGGDGYELTRSANRISLYDILRATNQQLNLTNDASEQMYTSYRTAANRLGVIGRIARNYLEEIKLCDF